MKELIAAFALLTVGFCNGQAFNGKNDNKFQIGVNFQSGGTGLHATYDYGIGENISLGLASTYVLGVDNGIDADFSDRFDLRARFNANIGNVLKIDENFDFYPGLSLGLKNFGGHVGARYFFSEGFGIYTEINAPLAKYNTDDLSPAEELNNQFTFSFGASFNI
jgi:outer membrane protein G